jgi:hypothetical protein
MSTNSGGNWGDISGATSTTLTFAAPYSMNGRQYRAVFTNSCGSVTTSAATLTVLAPPTISVSVSPSSLWPPNNSMRTINASITTTGNCTPLAVTLVSITSDEGDESNDVSGATFNSDDRSFSLRAQRNGNGDGRSYTITYRVTDNAGNTATATATVVVPHNNSKLVVTPAESAPEVVVLEQNIPNPFTEETEIGFTLGLNTEVTLKIFDANGRVVATLVHDQLDAGHHSVRWKGRDEDGHPVADGIYLCQVQAGETIVTSRMVLLR